MESFSDYKVWGFIMIFAVLLTSLLVANGLKRNFKFLRASLIPTPVLAGLMLLAVSIVYNLITGDQIFNLGVFNYEGMTTLEIITYHALALGFIASTLKNEEKQLTKQRAREVFDTGVTTVATYLLQAVLGFGITILAAWATGKIFMAAGVLLPFGYGQGPGQAMNYGGIYEAEHGFIGGKSFGLTVAALGFLSASLGGVIHLSLLRKKGKIVIQDEVDSEMDNESIQSKGEIPMNGGIDKLTVQFGFILLSYALAYGLIFLLAKLVPGFSSVLYGFNFLIGVLTATLVKAVLKFCRKKNIVKKQYTSNFLLNRISNFCFDIMVVAGIAAIRLDALKDYWAILLILGVVGLVSTYAYNYFIAKKLFSGYADEQFLGMYGMLTGTASTGVVLLREIDG
ncbi:MAG: hypothetical protein IKB20_02905, partial [Clostridia bacterium]|nr:hypothetical protein [Clostridia bacterium]